jgi:hypothetical protein
VTGAPQYFLKPKYQLAEIKSAFRRGNAMNWTRTAQDFAFGNGWSTGDVFDLIQSISAEHFYKSMDSHMDGKTRQDVYYVPCSIQGDLEGVELYVKFTANANGLLLISLKESDR